MSDPDFLLRWRRRALLMACPALAGIAFPAAASDLPGSLPAPATGSRWALPAANLSKSAAVLGGASAMAQVLVAQRSDVRISSLATPVGGFGPRIDQVPAIARPNVFGSVALAVSHTPLDRQWARASVRPAWRPATIEAASDPLESLRRVNRWVNARITFTDDIAFTGRADLWSGAAETLARGRGDCEDYALAKMQILRGLGFDADRLFLVVVRDLVRRADHAVLVVQLEDRFAVLDNMTDDVLDSNQVRDYRPVMSYSDGGRWIHGYAARPASAPVRLASRFAAAP